MKTRLVLLAILVLVVAFTGAHAEQPSVTPSTDMVGKLINGSPWRGTATFPARTFQIEFAFSKDSKGKLQGELVSTTSLAALGPLKFVEVKGKKVTFFTPVGAEYELEFDRDRLVGVARVSGASATVELSTSK